MIAIRYSEKEKQNFIEEYRNSGLTMKEFANRNFITESNLRKWVQEDKEATFDKISTNTLALEFNIEKTLVFKNKNMSIELKEGFDKEYFKKIVEVLLNDK